MVAVVQGQAAIGRKQRFPSAQVVAVVPAPQLSSQPAPVQRHSASAEAHLSVQPPSGQSTRQTLVPRQVAVALPPRTKVQVLPPSQVTPESAPATKLQVLVPAQVPVELVPSVWVQVLIAVHELSQLEPQVPLHTVEFAQCEAQSVPQVTVQVLFLLQSKVRLLGGSAAVPAPPSAAPPTEQVPPLAQVQVSPVH